MRALLDGWEGVGPAGWVEPIAPWLWRIGTARAYLAHAIAWGAPSLPR